MRIAHFVHRYPPALGGSEAYFARLSRFLAAQGDQVTVFTTIEGARAACLGLSHLAGLEVYALQSLHGKLGAAA